MSKRARSPSRSPTLAESECVSRSLTPSTTATPPPAPLERISHLLTAEVMHCSLPPHRETLTFGSYEDYEVHYQQAHVNRCSECAKNFPTGHLLNLHIEENHDALAAARRARGEKTYGCFIETCERKCSTPQKRRRHLIDKHMFPRTYNFYIINDGIDKQTSLLRPLNGNHRRRISAASISSAHEGRLRRRSSVSRSNATAAATSASECLIASHDVCREELVDEMEIDDLEKSMSALRFVPTSVTKQRAIKKTS